MNKVKNNEVVKLPNAYNGMENVQNGYIKRIDLHFQDGFFDLIIPELRENEKLGELIKKDDYYTYEIEPIPELTEAELTAQRKVIRNQLLKEGVIVQNIWFNELLLTQFTVMAQMCYTSNIPSFEWGKEDGWGTVTIDEAFEIVKQASSEFSQIYKEHS